jgi:hypothetical protein
MLHGSADNIEPYFAVGPVGGGIGSKFISDLAPSRPFITVHFEDAGGLDHSVEEEMGESQIEDAIFIEPKIYRESPIL